MKIDRKSQGVVSAELTTKKVEKGAEESAKAKSVGTTASRKTDEVQISAAGRALSQKGDALSPERIAQIRQRILEGAYNSTHVVDAVARNILSSGDL